MSIKIRSKTCDAAHRDTAYLSRRRREEAHAAASAHSVAGTLLHVALANAYAERCCGTDDRAWIAEHRLW